MTIDRKELLRVSEDSRTEHLSIWFNAINGGFAYDFEADPATDHWILDTDEYITPGELESITASIMNDIENGLY